jgi:hypothetical protein
VVGGLVSNPGCAGNFLFSRDSTSMSATR